MKTNFPYHFDSLDRIDTCDAQHIHEMIEKFLFTQPGEYVNYPDFGIGLMDIIFEPSNPELIKAVEFNIVAGLQRWLGDLIEIITVEVTSQEDKVYVLMQYAMRRTGEIISASWDRLLPD